MFYVIFKMVIHIKTVYCNRQLNSKEGERHNVIVENYLYIQQLYTKFPQIERINLYVLHLH